MIVGVVRRAFGLFTTVQAKLDRLNVVTRETLLGIRVIKAFVTEDRQQAKFEVSNEELLTWNVKAQRLIILLMPFVTFVGNLAVIAVLWLGGHYVQAGTCLLYTSHPLYPDDDLQLLWDECGSALSGAAQRLLGYFGHRCV